MNVIFTFCENGIVDGMSAEIKICHYKQWAALAFSHFALLPRSVARTNATHPRSLVTDKIAIFFCLFRFGIVDFLDAEDKRILRTFIALANRKRKAPLQPFLSHEIWYILNIQHQNAGKCYENISQNGIRLVFGERDSDLHLNHDSSHSLERERRRKNAKKSNFIALKLSSL